MPGVEGRIVDVIIAYVLELRTSIGEVVVVLVRVTASWAGIVVNEIGCFKHATCSERVSEYGSDVVVEVIIWLAVFWGEGSYDVFKNWGIWFAVK